MLTQAPVKPLDEDGVQVGVIGTLAWLVAAIVLLVRGTGPDQAWWLWACWAGVAVGLVGLGYCLRRRSRRRRHQPTREAASRRG